MILFFFTRDCCWAIGW